MELIRRPRGGAPKDVPLEQWHRDSLAGVLMPPANDRCLQTIGTLLCGLRQQPWSSNKVSQLMFAAREA